HFANDLNGAGLRRQPASAHPQKPDPTWCVAEFDRSVSELVVETRANDLGGQVSRGREVVGACVRRLWLVDQRVYRHLSNIQLEVCGAHGPMAIEGPLNSATDCPSNQSAAVRGRALG